MIPKEYFEKVPLSCEVMAITKRELKSWGKTNGMSLGDMIDRLVMRFPTKNPELAAMQVMETMSIIIAGQDNRQILETLTCMVDYMMSIASYSDAFKEKLDALVEKLDAENRESD